MADDRAMELFIKANTQKYAMMEIDHHYGDRAAKLWFLMSVL
jgi:hypothetical protein